MSWTIRFPELAAEDYDGGTIGQAARLFPSQGCPAGESRTLFESWRDGKIVPRGRGAQRVVTFTVLDDIDDVYCAFEALSHGARDCEEYALTRALTTAMDRCAEVLKDNGITPGRF